MAHISVLLNVSISLRFHIVVLIVYNEPPYWLSHVPVTFELVDGEPLGLIVGMALKVGIAVGLSKGMAVWCVVGLNDWNGCVVAFGVGLNEGNGCGGCSGSGCVARLCSGSNSSSFSGAGSGCV